MNRQRGILLGLMLLIFFAMSGWMIYRELELRNATFSTGAPPQEIEDVIVPKQLDVSQLRPPALLAGDYIRYGGVTSSASVIEYGDYECPGCKEMAPIIQRVLASYKGKIRYVWHDFPIVTQHDNALDAAVFVRCAGMQNAFWQAHDAIMQAKTVNELAFNSVTRTLRLDELRLNNCRRDKTISDTILREVDIARGDGISNAPTIFVGTKAFVGTLTEAELRAAIDAFVKL